MGIARELLLRGSESEWLAAQLTRRGLTRRAVQRFMPGEDVEAALTATESLREKGLTTILTLLGENVSNSEEVESVTGHYLNVLARVHQRQLDADISVKPTQFGIDLDFNLTYEGIRSLAKRADELGRMVAIDMESSAYVDRTLDLYRRLRSEFFNITLCLQAYLLRTADDLDALLPLQPNIRLVKGAYKEPSTIAYRHKKDVDDNFLRLTEVLFESAASDGRRQIYLGTHDPRLIQEIRQRAESTDFPKDRYEFQLLYGIQRPLQEQLAQAGYRTRVLISYGQSWFPWFMRRLAERPANLLFLVKNIVAN